MTTCLRKNSYVYTVFRDPQYAPVGFLICRKLRHGRWNARDDDNTILVDTDWDFPGLASHLGWLGCPHGSDGTVRCCECGKSPSEFISEAYDYLVAHQGERFDGSDYFGDSHAWH